MASLYRELLEIRHREIIPRLKGIKGRCGSYEILSEGAVSVRWTLGDGSLLRLVANFGDRGLPNISPSGRRLWSTQTRNDNSLDPWGVIWSLAGAGDPDGGRRA